MPGSAPTPAPTSTVRRRKRDPSWRNDRGFLSLAPEPDYDQTAWGRSPPTLPGADRRGLESDAAEPWSALLPRLRERRGLSLDGLAGAVSERLGRRRRQAAIPRAYLEDLERDRLVPERLSRRLLDALATVLDTPAAWLERAGAALAAPAGALYRRQGEGAVEQRLKVIADAMLADAADWDEVDELFQGGR